MYQDCAFTSEVPKRFKGPTKAYRRHEHLISTENRISKSVYCKCSKTYPICVCTRGVEAGNIIYARCLKVLHVLRASTFWKGLKLSFCDTEFWDRDGAILSRSREYRVTWRRPVTLRGSCDSYTSGHSEVLHCVAGCCRVSVTAKTKNLGVPCVCDTWVNYRMRLQYTATPFCNTVHHLTVRHLNMEHLQWRWLLLLLSTVA